jgi:hypothetical protein
MSTQNQQAPAATGNGSFQLAANTHQTGQKLSNANSKSVTLADSGTSQAAPYAPEVMADLSSATFSLFACLMALVIAKYKLRQWLLG